MQKAKEVERKYKREVSSSQKKGELAEKESASNAQLLKEAREEVKRLNSELAE